MTVITHALAVVLGGVIGVAAMACLIAGRDDYNPLPREPIIYDPPLRAPVMEPLFRDPKVDEAYEKGRFDERLQQRIQERW